MLNITDKKLEEKIPAWLRLGFRPFFLFGSIYAIVAIALWVWMFQSGQPNVLAVPALWWHVHEMLFGFSMAIVVGFVSKSDGLNAFLFSIKSCTKAFPTPRP